MKLGIVGWRGMVGSVLLSRMAAENDFAYFDTSFFSTSMSGQSAPRFAGGKKNLMNASDVNALSEMDVIVSCQGGQYTKEVHPKLREAGWNGYWIDAASTLRMEPNAVIVLDPVNRSHIETAIDDGIKDFVGGNCSITLTLIGLASLFKAGLVEWMSTMTYQAASGAGAAHIRELIAQMGVLHHAADGLLKDPGASILDIDKSISHALVSPELPVEMFGAPLAGNILPWIDSDLGNGMSREEWKGEAEANKILGLPTHTIPIDGLCIRVGAMRSHAAALTIKLKENLSLDEIEKLIQSNNPWVDLIPNTKSASIEKLTPAAVSGSLKVAVGRLRKMSMGENYLTAMTIGDQLLWGAAEPLRRTLRLLVERKR